MQNRILAVLGLLRARGPMLCRPHVVSIAGSKIANLKELRVQIDGEPWRILFAFDARRSAILLVGGSKGGDARWYETNIPIAEARARDHGL